MSVLTTLFLHDCRVAGVLKELLGLPGLEVEFTADDNGVTLLGRIRSEVGCLTPDHPWDAIILLLCGALVILLAMNPLKLVLPSLLCFSDGG